MSNNERYNFTGIATPFADALPQIDRWNLSDGPRRVCHFMACDLLHGSMLRDYRVPLFRKWVADPADWILERVKGLEQRSAAIRHLALHAMHARHLIGVREKFESSECDFEVSIVDRLLNCWPRGVRVVAAEESSIAAKICRLPRLCPWCFARQGLNMFYSILRGPLKYAKPRTTALLLGKWRLHETSAEPGDLCGAIRKARTAYIADYLRPFVSNVGMDGGIVIHEVTSLLSPNIAYDHPRDPYFAHDLAILGAVRLTSERVSRELEERIHDVDGPIFVNWVVGHGDIRQQLRCMLFGASQGYMSRCLDGRAKASFSIAENNSDLNMRRGFAGAMTLQPTFLLDPERWWTYGNDSRKFPLFRTFGSWRGQLVGKNARSKRSLVLPSQSKRILAFHSANEQRSAKAAQRRRQLLDVAQAVECQVYGSGPRRIGWSALRKAMDRVGHPISERDSRWLAGELRLRPKG